MEFRYQAVDAQGRPCAGQIEAPDERTAVRLLAQKELMPTELSALGGAAAPGSRQGRLKRTRERDKALIVQELATLLHAGIPLAEAVESLGSSHADSALGAAFMRIRDSLRAGASFASALAGCGMAWPPYLHQLATAGEHTGKLAQALFGAAEQMEYEERVRQEMRNALIYPTILVVSGIAATLMVFLVVVPKFSGLLKSTRAELPAVSVWVLRTGQFVNEHLLAVGLVATACVLGMAVALGNAAVRARLLESAARLPVLGDWLLQTETGRWAAMLGTLLENRVPILVAMELAEAGLRLGAMRHRLQQALREIRAGRKVADALRAGGMADATALNLVRVGERSGELPRMLRTLAVLHENAGRERLKRFMILLEPAAILIIGGAIGFIMVAIMLAITSLSNVSL